MHIINNWITKQYIGTVDTSKLGTSVYIYYLIRVPVNDSDQAMKALNIERTLKREFCN